ncbi:MAG: Gfo/Idh/MocA family oxidoreductase, partial [Planctomycetes bacterium]|nr:Gfo/Idh/MocA family oxidoreductase [Planctomycetota bacterium]
MKKIRWGIISTAKIGTEKVIPAMQQSRLCDITAIASRDINKAKQTAADLEIAKAYGSYDALLADPDIDAIYNPLPNHLHVEWSIKTLQSGKHILCEKPIGLSSDEGQKLVDFAKSKPQLKTMEAFMYRHHPQWVKARSIVQDGGVGELKAIQSFFSYTNPDPQNIRNQADIGGGGL